MPRRFSLEWWAINIARTPAVIVRVPVLLILWFALGPLLVVLEWLDDHLPGWEW